MLEQIRGIEVQGRGFVERRTFPLFNKEHERVALVFGRNGSGKSTMAAAFRQLNPASFDERISVSIFNKDGTVLPVQQTDASWKNYISVFDEKYVNETVCLKSSAQGIGTIVLFADLADVDAQIEAANNKLKEKREKQASINEELKDFDDSGNPCSPEYHVNRMIDSLKGTWAEKDREVKSNIKKSQVNRDLALTVAQMECATPKKDIVAEIAKSKSDLSAVERVSDVDGIPSLSMINAGSFDEVSFVNLLNQHMDRPELNERERRILELMDTHAKRIEEVKGTFSHDETAYCPYCFRDITNEDKLSIVASVEKVLNREVEDYKERLLSVVFPQYDFNVKIYEPIDDELPEAVANEVGNCKRIVEEYRSDVARKSDNVFSDVTFVTRNLLPAIEAANRKILQLEQKRTSLSAMAARKSKIKANLIRLYKEEAHYQIATSYKSYTAKLKEKADKQNESILLAREVETIEQEIQELEARKAGTDIAVGCINKSLRYIFVSDKRFTIEAHDGEYVLKSRGHDVSPGDVSTGERHILALAYFFVDIMAHHSRKDFYKDERFIVIDDPVSSYDQENKVGVYSFLMREFENVLAGNANSRVVLLTHDIQTMFGMGKALEFLIGHRFKQEKYAYVPFEIRDDGTLVSFEMRNRHEYSCLLHSIYDFAKNGEASPRAMTIGNEMRRALEAYSTFLYRMDFLLLFRSELFAGKLGCLAEYFSARMDRIVLNGESHMQNQARSLALEADFFAIISDAERQQTARDVLCLLYLLDENHIVSHFGANEQMVGDIRGWLEQLRQVNSADCNV